MPDTSLIEKAVDMDRTLSQNLNPTISRDRGPFKQTESGRKYYFLNPRPDEINFSDIASQLAKTPRYNGATNGVFYSVAQHCSIMCNILPESLKPYALLHDAHEAYTGDLTTPFQWALGHIHPEARAAVKELQYLADMAIYPAANIPFPLPENITRAIKDADNQMLAAEKDQLLIHTDWGMDMAKPAPVKIIPKSWDNALDEYMFNLEKWVFPLQMINRG